jgi:hypothetical protein
VNKETRFSRAQTLAALVLLGLVWLVVIFRLILSRS